MSKNDVRWIQISDLHIGHSASKWLDDTLQKELIYFLKNDIGRIDYILVTGDIIHQGKYNDHSLVEAAKKLFEQLKSVSNKIIFAIGNHDYKRVELRFDTLKNWQNTSDKVSEEDDYKRSLKPAFDDFISLIKEIMDDDYCISADTYIYKEVEEINVVVFNTSIFAGQPVLDESGNFLLDKDGQKKVNDYKKLWISDSSIPKINEIDLGKPTIVIGHHPIEFFENTASKRIESFINKVKGIYRCGHMHTTESRKFNDIKENVLAGLFADEYNEPSFSYSILKLNENTKPQTRVYSYKNYWSEIPQMETLRLKGNVISYSSLKAALKDIASDIESSSKLCFFGLQGSTFLSANPIIYTAIESNKDLKVKFLVANPYSSRVRDRLKQIPRYKNQTIYEKKLKEVINYIFTLKQTYGNHDRIHIKYHKLPLMFRCIFTDKHLYIGMYENKDTTESRMYRFINTSDIFEAAFLHFNYAWNNATSQISEITPPKYRILQEKFAVTPSLVINVTDKCTMNCFYCPKGGENLCDNLEYCGLKSIKLLIKKFKDAINGSEKAVIRITGGEPFYGEAIERTLCVLKEASINRFDKVVLCTNGINFSDVYRDNQKTFEDIKESLLLKISIDSLIPEVFNKITKTENLLDKVKRNIIFAHTLGFKIELNIVATEHNINEIMDIYRFAAENNLVGIKILTVNDFGGRVTIENTVENNLVDLIHELRLDDNFGDDIDVFLNDNKGIEMKRFKDQNGCTITIVDHENTSESVTPRRIFCQECKKCEYYPLSPHIGDNIKPCATGVMNLCMRMDGELSYCRLQKGTNINNKKEDFIDMQVKKLFDIFNNCFVLGTSTEED